MRGWVWHHGPYEDEPIESLGQGYAEARQPDEPGAVPAMKKDGRSGLWLPEGARRGSIPVGFARESSNLNG